MTTRFDEKLLKEKGFELQSDGGWAKPSNRNKRLPDADVKRPDQKALVGLPSRKKPSKESTPFRFKVEIVVYRKRLLDEDNFVGGCKPLIDQIRYAGFIPDDAPKNVEFAWDQRQTKTGEKDKTEIKITRIQ